MRGRIGRGCAVVALIALVLVLSAGGTFAAKSAPEPTYESGTNTPFMCTGDPQPLQFGSGTAAPAAEISKRCPRAEADIPVDVRIAIDRADSARVDGLGEPLRMSLMRLRTTHALAGKRVLIHDDGTRTTTVAAMCAALRGRGVDAFRPARSLALRGVHTVEPRRAYQLTRPGNQWINLTNEPLELQAVDSLSRVPYARYGDAIETVLRKLTDDMPGPSALVLMDRKGELAGAVRSLDTSAIGTTVYYIEGGYAAWTEWRRMNRQIVLAHAAAGRPQCGD